MQLRKLAAAMALAVTLPAGVLAQQDGATSPAPAKQFDVKNTFRNICGFCHEDYGRKAGKGPQLMDNPNSDQFLFNRIKSGKPGRMAAFGGVFTDDQIHEMVKFIRALKPGVAP
jgi:mono/diheme cytochrome c family protein